MDKSQKPERTELLLSKEHKERAMQKAAKHLDSFSGIQKKSLSEALRYCIDSAPDSSKPKSKK